MIECPICHVVNEDKALFCSECGQRFNNPAPAAPAASPPGFIQNLAGQPAPQAPGQSPFPGPGQLPPGYTPAPDYSQQPPSAAPGQAGSPFVQAPQPSFNAPPAFNAPGPTVNYADPAANPGGYANYDQVVNAAAQQVPDVPGAPVPQAAPMPQTAPPMQSAPPMQAAPPMQSMMPPQEQQPAEPPKRTRPRLHSPILGEPDPDIEDEPEIQQQKESGKRGLRSPLFGRNESEPAPKPRGKGLHSPLLGGDEDDDQPPPQNPRGKGLHSPLLGGDDDDDPASKRGGQKSGRHLLRSPLLGGDDDDEEPAPPKRGGGGGGIPFPHRSKPAPTADYDDEPHDAPPASKGKAHLRSPLLGSSDDDDFEEPAPKRGRKDDSGRFAPRQEPPAGGKPRLRSALLGGGSYDDFDEEAEEDYSDDDPTILRSPLLAAKQRLPVEKPDGPAQPPMAAPPQQLPAPMPQQTLPAPQTPPSFSQPLVPQSAPQPQQLPNQGAAEQFARDRQFPSAQPGAVEFRDRTMPEPVPSQAEFRDRGFAPNAAPPADSSSPELRTAPHSVPPSSGQPSGSFKARPALLAHMDEEKPRHSRDIYESGERPALPAKSAGPNYIVIAIGIIALLCKAKLLLANLPFLSNPKYADSVLDQLGTMLIGVGLIIFAAMPGKKS